MRAEVWRCAGFGLFSVLFFLHAVAQTRNDAASCPIKLERLDLVPDHIQRGSVNSPHLRVLALRMGYTNVSYKVVAGARVLVEAFFYSEAPTHYTMERGTRVVNLAERLHPGEKKTIRVARFSGPGSPKAWLEDVLFADGSRWVAKEQSQCLFVSPRMKLNVGVVIPASLK